MMFEAKSYDLQDASRAVGGDSESWILSSSSRGEGINSPSHFRTRSSSLAGSSSVAASNVDRVLYNDLVEIVPLVQRLIDGKAGSSFTRRGSMVYTKTPSKELLYRKLAEPKGRNTAQSIPAKKKKRDPGDKDNGRDGSGNNEGADSFSMFSSKTLAAEREELVLLREQVEDLQRKLLEKEELLESAEITKNEMSSVYAQLEELRQESAEKDSILRSIQLQLSDARIKLADKQAALEKTQWEAMTSMIKAEKLQEELDTIQSEVSLFTSIFQDLTSNNSLECSAEYDVAPYYVGDLTSVDDLGSTDKPEMEEARLAYITAVAQAKEKQDEESMALAAKARLHLQSFIF